MDDFHHKVQEAIRLKNKLWPIYMKVATGHAKPDAPAFPGLEEFENWCRQVVDIFHLQLPSKQETRIGIFLSFIADSECEKWIPRGQFNPQLLSLIRKISNDANQVIPDEEELRLKRIPEFVIAYLNGWRNTSEGRLFDPAMAESIIIACLSRSTQYTFNWLKRIGQELPEDIVGKRDILAEDMHDQISFNEDYCDCCKREQGLELGPVGEKEANSIPLKTCASRHKINSWNPNPQISKKGRVKTESLWDFLQTAVKGSSGSFKPGSFRSGILRKTLKFKYNFDIQWAPIAVRACDNCGQDRRTMVNMSGEPIAKKFKSRTLDTCSQCDSPLPQNTPILSQPGLIIPNGPHMAKQMFRCSKCEHHFEPVHCTSKSECKKQDDQSHDVCPRDKVSHSIGKRLPLHTLYFFDVSWPQSNPQCAQTDESDALQALDELPKIIILNNQNMFSENLLGVIRLIDFCVLVKQSKPFCRSLPVIGQKADWKKISAIVSRMNGSNSVNSNQLKKEWEENKDEIFSLLKAEQEERKKDEEADGVNE